MQNKPVNTELYAHTLLIVVTLLAASGWLFSKFVISAITPMFFLAIRFVISGLMVGGLKPRQVLSTSVRKRRRALMTGCLLGVQTAVWGAGLLLSEGLGAGAFLLSLSFLLIPVTGLFFGYRAKMHTWISVAIAVPGLIFLALRNGFVLVPSDILFLVSAVLYALYFNVNGKYCSDIPPVTQTCFQLISAGTICFIAYLVTEQSATQSVSEVWQWLVLSIVLATCLRFFFLLKAQSMSPEGQGAIVMTLEPVWVAILSAWWLNESLNTMALTGMAIIFLALVVNAIGSLLAGRKQKLAAPGQPPIV
ncbi:MAG: EamA family transporter [Alteromonadaceae bacterium]|nr:EamA family transporter [Alteromonadaceae bacterium]